MKKGVTFATGTQFEYCDDPRPLLYAAYSDQVRRSAHWTLVDPFDVNAQATLTGLTVVVTGPTVARLTVAGPTDVAGLTVGPATRVHNNTVRRLQSVRTLLPVQSERCGNNTIEATVKTMS